MGFLKFFIILRKNSSPVKARSAATLFTPSEQEKTLKVKLYETKNAMIYEFEFILKTAYVSGRNFRIFF